MSGALRAGVAPLPRRCHRPPPRATILQVVPLSHDTPGALQEELVRSHDDTTGRERGEGGTRPWHTTTHSQQTDRRPPAVSYDAISHSLSQVPLRGGTTVSVSLGPSPYTPSVLPECQRAGGALTDYPAVSAKILNPREEVQGALSHEVGSILLFSGTFSHFLANFDSCCWALNVKVTLGVTREEGTR